MVRFGCVVILFCFLISCSTENECIETPDVSDVDLSIKVTRLEKYLFQLKSVDEIILFFQKYPVFTNYFIDAYEYPSDTILAQRTFGMINEPHITDTLYTETLQTFGNLEELTLQFEHAFKLIKHYFPEFNPPQIQTAVTAFYKDLFLSDTLIIVGIDHYLGKNATYHPMDIPQYILDRYEPENLVPMIIYFLSDRFNMVNLSTGTLLDEMIDFGKAYYFTKQMVPCASDAQIIGYSNEVMDDVEENQEIIWANFIQNELFYETSHEVKVKFIGERPNIPEIGQKCPGRIARWLGYEIVKTYMKANPVVTLPELMQETDAVKIFTQSKYKPQNH